MVEIKYYEYVLKNMKDPNWLTPDIGFAKEQGVAVQRQFDD